MKRASWLLVTAIACSDPRPVVVGTVLSSEGLEGARFAAADVNANGGVRGRPLVLREIAVRDAGSRAALAAAESLASNDDVIAVVGHPSSAASLTGSQVYNQRRIVQIAPTSSAVPLSDAGPYTYRLVASDIHQARFIADHIVARGAQQTVAIFFVNDDYGRSLRHELMTILAQAGVRIVLEHPYVESSPLPDPKGVAVTLAQSGADVMVWLGRSGHLGQLAPHVRAVAPDVRIIGSDGLDTRETVANVSGAFTGVQFACFVDVTAQRPDLVAMRDRYARRTGHTITAELALAYDAVMLIAEAARDEGPDREAINDYLNSLDRSRPPYRGAVGDFAFDERGDPRPSYCLAEVTAAGIRMASPAGGQ